MARTVRSAVISCVQLYPRDWVAEQQQAAPGERPRETGITETKNEIRVEDDESLLESLVRLSSV